METESPGRGDRGLTDRRRGPSDKPHLIDADYEKAARFAALVAPYRHARLRAVKLAGDPNNFKDDASADELREAIIQDLGRLVSAGVIDLKALPGPDGAIANRPIPGVRTDRDCTSSR